MQRITKTTKVLIPVLKHTSLIQNFAVKRHLSSTLKSSDKVSSQSDDASNEPFNTIRDAAEWSVKEQQRIDREREKGRLATSRVDHLSETDLTDAKDNDLPPLSNNENELPSEWKFLLDGEADSQRNIPLISTKEKEDSHTKNSESKPSDQMQNDERQMFQRLLDSLLENPAPPRRPAESKPVKTNQGSLAIEKQLMDLMKQKTPLYKRTSGVPSFVRKRRPLLSSVFNRNTPTWRLPTTKPAQTMVQERDQAYSIINRLLQTQTNTELRDFVSEHVFGEPPRSGGRIESYISNGQLNAIDSDSATLPIIPSYYSALISAAISHALTFHDPYMALTIFEQTKQRGLDSYVTGCTTEVYNHILRARWDYWQDVQGMEVVIDEMMFNGVGFDDRTRQIISLVMSKVMGDQYSDSGELMGGSGGQWGDDDRRAINRMVEMVGKWLVKYP